MQRLPPALRPYLTAGGLVLALLVMSQAGTLGSAALRLYAKATDTLPAAPQYGPYTAEDLVTVTDYERVSMPAVVEDERKMLQMINQLGLVRTMEKLSEDPAYQQSDGMCHGAAHIVGNAAFDLMGAAAFEQCNTLCFSGCYHGVLQQMGIRAGPDPAELVERLEELCVTRRPLFERNQCFHGAGHGFLLENNYQLARAVESCRLFAHAPDTYQCYGGVFMEHLVGDGSAQRLRPDDVHYPCNLYPDDPDAQDACYRIHTTYFVDTHGDVYRSAQECLTAPLGARYACFMRLGQLSGVDTEDPPGNTEAFCATVPEAYYPNCILGGLRQVVNFNGVDPTGIAASFCKELKNQKGKRICYEQYAQDLLTLFDEPEPRLAICNLFEAPYDTHCREIQE